MFGISQFALLAAGIVLVSLLTGALVQKIADHRRSVHADKEAAAVGQGEERNPQ